MEFGISLSLARIPLTRAMPLSSLAERNGFGTVSVGEAAHDSFAAATAMAISTNTTRIMTGVTTWVRPPILTATAAATVDEISGGRFTLGLGTMPDHWNRDHYGIDPTKPLERMREYLDVIRRTLGTPSGSPIDYEGERFSIRGYRRAAPPLRADVPIVLAATRPGMARLAGEIADGVYFNVIHTVDGLRDSLVPAVEQGEQRRSAGPESIERILMLRCSIDDDADLAWERLRESLRMYLGVPYFAGVARSAGFDVEPAMALARVGQLDDAVRAIPMELVQQMGIAGTARACREQLDRYRDIIDTVVFAPPSGIDADAGVEQIIRILEADWHDGRLPEPQPQPQPQPDHAA